MTGSMATSSDGQESLTDALAAARARRFFIDGHPVDPISGDELLALAQSAIDDRAPITIANINLHGLYAARRSAPMRALMRSSRTVVHIDGMPIVWLGRLFGRPVTRAQRLAHIDIIPRLLRLAARNRWRVAFVGGREDAVAAASSAFWRIAPTLDIACFTGYFDTADLSRDGKQSSILREIHRREPDLLLVGMGMPAQEEWIQRLREEFGVPVVMPVGGFIDYFTGATAMPPRWLGQIGLEWAFRLASDPRRLFYRYCVEPAFLIGPLARQFVRHLADAR